MQRPRLDFEYRGASTGPSEPGRGGGQWTPHIFAGQLTLFHLWVADVPVCFERETTTRETTNFERRNLSSNRQKQFSHGSGEALSSSLQSLISPSLVDDFNSDRKSDQTFGI